MRDGPDGGRSREETEHQLWRFRFRGLEKKKRVFFWFFLLFDFIAMLLPIYHCPIYCLTMTRYDMMHICSHYC